MYNLFLCFFFSITVLVAKDTSLMLDYPFENHKKIDYQKPVFKYGGFFEKGYFYHIITQKETLFSISKKYLPFTDSYDINSLIKKLQTINQIANPYRINKKKIIIPVSREEKLKISSKKRNYDFFSTGIYLSAISVSSRFGYEQIKKFHEAGGNTVIFDLKDVSGNIYYSVKTKTAHETGAVKTYFIKDFNKVVHLIHNFDMHAVARMTMFADRNLSEKRPDLAIKNLSNQRFISHGKTWWVDASHPEVRQYNYDLIKEICGSGIDEIQLDYVRFPGTREPLKLYNPQKPRDKIITEFVRSVYSLTQHYNILLSVDVYGIVIWESEIDIQILGQRLHDLALYTDAINPMIYPSHFSSNFAGFPNPGDYPYQIISMGIKKLKKKVNPQKTQTVIRPWIQAFDYKLSEFNPEYIYESIQGSIRYQKSGYIFWAPKNNYAIVFKALHKYNVLTNEQRL